MDNCPKIKEDCECKWSPWSKCSTTCDPGRQSRTRTCSDDFGDKCVESFSNQGHKDGDIESQWCNKENSCSGDWTDWGPWDKCSETCGGGQQQRMRFCSSGFPNLPGSSCIGDSTQVQYCNSMPCEEQLCEDSYFDLCFLIEASSTMGNGFIEALKFVDSCQKHFPSEPNELNWRLCLSSFSCQTENHWTLADTPSSFSDASSKINAVEHGIECGIESDFQFSKSLENFVQNQLTEKSGRRLAKFDPQLGLMDSGVAGVVVVILITPPEDAFYEQILSLKNNVDKVIVIGIGPDFTDSLLEKMSSRTSFFQNGIYDQQSSLVNFHRVDNTEDLSVILTERVIHQTCTTDSIETQCLYNNGLCDQICITEYTGKQCYCEIGYKSADDGYGCVEI